LSFHGKTPRENPNDEESNMSTYNSIFILAAGVLLSGLSAQQAAAAEGALTLTSQPGGFLTRSDRRAPRIVDGDSGHLIDRLCARTARSSEPACPASLQGNAGFPGGPPGYSAGLHHLRLNIILREMRNVVISGSGVDSLGAFQEPWATFKIVSNAADNSIPTPAAPPYGLPVPAPGDTWSDIPHANGLFQGIIENGCMGAPATFDLTLDSSIIRISTNAVLGAVHLVDGVDGYGYYNFKYTIRAKDEAGNVSDFIFSGDADSFCTGQFAL
jgi:hypothetical protein